MIWTRVDGCAYDGWGALVAHLMYIAHAGLCPSTSAFRHCLELLNAHADADQMTLTHRAYEQHL